MGAHETELKKFYAGGVWHPAPSHCQRQPLIDPATGEVCGVMAMATRCEIDAAVTAAKEAFPSYSSTTRDERIDLLERISAVYLKRFKDIAIAITREMGAPLAALSRPLQAAAGLGHFQTALACLKAYEFERMQGTTRLVREPMGVCALITPWNWPMNQVICKVAPALATGCTMVLKPSQYSSLSAQVLAEILHEAGVPAGVFNMVYGEGRTLGEALAGHPDVDMVSLTGSTAAGQQVARTAAATIKRVSLELGGKSANVILPDAPLAEAITHGVLQMMGNTGQSCNAPSRMLVQRDSLQQVEQIAAATCARIVVGDPMREDVHMGPLANERQFKKVNAMIEQAVRDGARVVAGGPGSPAGLKRGYFVRPTVLSDVTNDMEIAREEVFGPVLVLIPYDTVDDAVRIANDSVYGLSGYVYGATTADAEKVARRLRTGMVHLNGASADLAAPFGGYKQSGIGREWGAFGFDEFVEVKAIMGAA